MIEQGQLAPEDVYKLLEVEDVVWVRLGATRDQGEWQESIMEVTSGVAPPRWSPQRWAYDEVIFVTAEVTGSEVASWLRTGSINLESIVIKLPAIQEGQLLQWWTYSSNANQTGFSTWIAGRYRVGLVE